MKLGAQFYSIRDYCADAAGLRNAFRLVKEIGYEAVQISGIGSSITAQDIANCVKEFDLPVPCTHSPYDRIINDTEALIAEHRLYGATEIGLGGIVNDLRKDLPTLRDTLGKLRVAAQKINAAGLTFAYHNHHREFLDIGGTTMYDLLIEECPEINFIHDVYWSVYAGKDPIYYINLLGKRMINIHFKDMDAAPQGKICPCGEGIIDFKPIYDACVKNGIQNVYVEQDNAPDFGDSMAQMAISYKNLAPLFR